MMEHDGLDDDIQNILKRERKEGYIQQYTNQYIKDLTNMDKLQYVPFSIMSHIVKLNPSLFVGNDMHKLGLDCNKIKLEKASGPKMKYIKRFRNMLRFNRRSAGLIRRKYGKRHMSFYDPIQIEIYAKLIEKQLPILLGLTEKPIIQHMSRQTNAYDPINNIFEKKATLNEEVNENLNTFKEGMENFELMKNKLELERKQLKNERDALNKDRHLIEQDRVTLNAIHQSILNKEERLKVIRNYYVEKDLIKDLPEVLQQFFMSDDFIKQENIKHEENKIMKKD